MPRQDHLGDIAVEVVAQLHIELDINLVVPTTHGRRPFRRAWLGSTADELLRTLRRTST